MKIRRDLVTMLVLGGLLAAATVQLGCDGDSPEGIVRNVGVIVEGFYMHPTEGSKLVSQTSGADVTSLNLRQSGDQLEGIDNNNIIFRGTIGQVVENSNASFTLNGTSSSGAQATISGTISVSGTQATMRGTWIEPTLYGTVYGQATVPTNAPPSGGGGNLAISPSNPTSVVNTPFTLTASGGTAPYNWAVSDATTGDISFSGTGETARYTARSVGSNSIILGDNEGRTARTTINSVANSGGPSTP